MLQLSYRDRAMDIASEILPRTVEYLSVLPISRPINTLLLITLGYPPLFIINVLATSVLNFVCLIRFAMRVQITIFEKNKEIPCFFPKLILLFIVSSQHFVVSKKVNWKSKFPLMMEYKIGLYLPDNLNLRCVTGVIIKSCSIWFVFGMFRTDVSS